MRTYLEMPPPPKKITGMGQSLHTCREWQRMGTGRWASARTGKTWGWFRAAYRKTAPRETEAEGADAQATRVRPTDPLPVPPGGREPGVLEATSAQR